MKLLQPKTILGLLVVAVCSSEILAQHLPTPLRPVSRRPTSVFRTSWRGFDTSTQSVARWPYSARAADLDGDGHPDLAVVNWWQFPKLGILLNRGDGSLAQPVYYTFAKGAQDLVIADFTGDGAPDVAVSNTGANSEGNTVSLFRNLGQGTFSPQQQFTVGSGSFVGPVGLAAADFSGDGRVDLAVALYGYIGQGTQVALLVNNSAGGFLPQQLYDAGLAPHKLAAGDLDGDARPDLVVARDSEQVSVLRNLGGGFAAPVSYDGLSLTGFDNEATVELADVDKDGDLDVLYATNGTSVNSQGANALLRNQGNGTLAPAEALFADDGPARDFAVGDVDGDTWPDILATTYSRWSLYRNDGQGGFLSAETYGATEIPVAVELADMDRDGRFDPVVVSRESLEAAVYINPGDGDFQTPTPVVATSFVPAVSRGMDAADIDDDGDLDVAVAISPLLTFAGSISILEGHGDGTFSAPVEYLTPVYPIYVKLADLNGDLRPDLLWADDMPPYHVRTRLNAGGGDFGATNTWTMNTCGNGEVAAIDVDGDGDLDIVLCEFAGCGGGGTGSQRIFIRKNNGDGTFQPPYVHNVVLFPQRVGGADVDADGRMDLLSTSNSWIDVSLGNGDGTFQPALAAACDWGPQGFCVADLDGDRVLDIATTNWGDLGTGGESMSILIGHGDGTFQPPVTTTASYSFTYGATRDIVAGDADGDGLLDVMASNYGSLDVSFYKNLGGGNFEPQVRYGTGWNTLGLVFGDFTGDGRGDLLTQSSFGVSLNFRPSLILLRSR